ncbi:hypothetical protein GGX14DRAFT_656373 [Mycena pura]|uniref:F-box domain-containing protein n=1 Tax=Mycena pura TaxID=153505 RepID=A0AAD6V5G5_9AGAR|nr:hypothetical protein GGX14DRAFT_656373 [Mycena pura]
MTVNHETLPCEIWLQIFFHLDTRTYSVSYSPFQPLPGVASEGHVCSAYSTVVLVCRNWRAWAVELLYRNIKLSDRSPLQEALDHRRGYGRWVRRAVVPYSTTATETCKPMPSTEILGLCPNLEVLVRPPYALYPMQTLRFEFDATCPSLASLKRLDWWNHMEAARSGGINSLTAVLAVAPNIEYLFIGATQFRFTMVPQHGLSGAPIKLPHLRTLRLNILNALLLHHIVYRWDLPALDNLVLDSPLVGAGNDVLWEVLGPRLDVVEFGRHVRFLLDQHLVPCLRGCPKLRELNYYLFAMAPPEMEPGESFPSVSSIKIQMSGTTFLDGEKEECAHFERHFDIFTGGIFPNLRRLLIFGMRQSVLKDARFIAMQKRLSDRGCILEFLDKSGF